MTQLNKLSNNFATSLSAGIASGSTTLPLDTTAGLPTLDGGAYVYLTLQQALRPSVIEIVKVTAIAGNSVTVVRGQDGTLAQAFAAGDYVRLNAVAANFNDLYSYIDSSSVSSFEGRTGAVALQATDMLGAVIATATGGTGDAITATFSPAVTALTDGITLTFKAGSSNLTNAPTFTPNSGVVAARTIASMRDGTLSTLVPYAITAGVWYTLIYSTSASAWILQNPAVGFDTTVTNTDDSRRIATTQFVKNVTGYRRVAAMSGGQTLTLGASDLGSTIYANSTGAAMTINLPPKASVGTGWRINIVLLSNTTLTIQTPAGDNSYIQRPGFTTSTSFAPSYPGTIELSFNSVDATWYATSGTFSFGGHQFQNRSIASSGWQQLPYGLIFQWGVQTLANNESLQTFSYPIAFPNAGLRIVANKETPQGSSIDGNDVGGVPLSATQYQLYMDAASTGVVVSWIAIGY